MPEQPIGYLPKDRLKLIPARHRSLHEIAFYFHDQAVACLKQFDSGRVRSIQLPAEKYEEVRRADEEGTDTFTMLREIGLAETAKDLSLTECALALSADALNFLCESLFNYEKRKIVVSLALLRKPLKENLLYLEWIVGNPDDFHEAFLAPDRKRVNIGAVPEEKKKNIMRECADKLHTFPPFDADQLYAIRYNKKNVLLEPLWQKASHLVTTQSKYWATEEENFNFIFANENVKDGIYDRVSNVYTLQSIYLYIVITQALSRIHKLHDGTIFYNRLCVLIALLVIAGKDCSKRQPFLEFRRVIEDHIKCKSCQKPISCPEKEIRRAFFARTIVCRNCKMPNRFDPYKEMKLRQRAEWSTES